MLSLPAPKSRNALKTIREVSDLLGVAPSALRFWEREFPAIRPLKLKGNRRYYRPRDIDAVARVKRLLYSEGCTIKEAKAKGNMTKEQTFIEADLLGEIRKTVKKSRGKRAAPEPATPSALTLDERKREQLEAVRAELFALQEIIRPYL